MKNVKVIGIGAITAIGTGSSAGDFFRKVQTIWYSVFRRCGEPRLVVGVLCASCLPDWFTAGLTPANPTMELRRGKRLTSLISAISCAAVVLPTPYMARTVSYSCSTRLSHILCKPPLWCFYYTPLWRFTQNMEWSLFISLPRFRESDADRTGRESQNPGATACDFPCAWD